MFILFCICLTIQNIQGIYFRPYSRLPVMYNVDRFVQARLQIELEGWFLVPVQAIPGPLGFRVIIVNQNVLPYQRSKPF